MSTSLFITRTPTQIGAFEEKNVQQVSFHHLRHRFQNLDMQIFAMLWVHCTHPTFPHVSLPLQSSLSIKLTHFLFLN